MSHEIEWEMDNELVTEPEGMLAHLIVNGIVFINCAWWLDDGDPERERTKLLVSCGDTFAYACADAEELPYSQIEVLYGMFLLDPLWGPTAWAVSRRKIEPIAPCKEHLVERSRWEYDALLRREIVERGCGKIGG